MRPERDLARLCACLDRAVEVVNWPEARLHAKDERISAWSPAQHVDHLSRILERVLQTVEVLVENEDPRILNTGHPVFAARVVLLAGWIPRGRGVAPDEFLPEPRPVRHRLRESLAGVRAQAQGLAGRTDAVRAAPGRIPHPLVGALSAPEWTRFAYVHTKHHLAILDEIDRRRALGVPVEGAVAPENGGCGAPAQAP